MQALSARPDVDAETGRPSNTLGIRRIMFAVDGWKVAFVMTANQRGFTRLSRQVADCSLAHDGTYPSSADEEKAGRKKLRVPG